MLYLLMALLRSFYTMGQYPYCKECFIILIQKNLLNNNEITKFLGSRNTAVMQCTSSTTKIRYTHLTLLLGIYLLYLRGVRKHLTPISLKSKKSTRLQQSRVLLGQMPIKMLGQEYQTLYKNKLIHYFSVNECTTIHSFLVLST